MSFGFGLGLGLGAGTLYGFMDRYIVRLIKDGSAGHPGIARERERYRNLHRRVQKAEGRLQRIDSILAEEDEE